MHFSVIYEADVSRDSSIRDYYPPQRRKLWDRTESGPGEYSYLGPAWTNRNGHGKWCAVLTKAQFDEFVDRLSLTAEDVETMGSIGAPGFGYGWAPAISFRGDEPGAMLSAYVTPFCTVGDSATPIRANGATEADWNRVRAAILRKYS